MDAFLKPRNRGPPQSAIVWKKVRDSHCTAGDNVKARQEDVATRYIGIGAWQTGQNNRTSRVMGREPAAG